MDLCSTSGHVFLILTFSSHEKGVLHMMEEEKSKNDLHTLNKLDISNSQMATFLKSLV